MGSRICPLLWQNCSITAADSLAARVIIWYVFFTAVGSFSDLVWQPDSIETGATAAYQPSTTSGAQSALSRHTTNLHAGARTISQAGSGLGVCGSGICWRKGGVATGPTRRAESGQRNGQRPCQAGPDGRNERAR